MVMRKAKPIQVWKCFCPCGQWMVEHEEANGWLTTLAYPSFSMAIYRAGQKERELKMQAAARFVMMPGRDS